MKKLLLTLSACIALISLLSFTALADNLTSLNTDTTIGTIDGFSPLVDNADILSPAEEQQIFNRIQQIHNDYDFDVTILTLKTLPSGVYDIYDFCDYYTGLDPSRNGVVFGLNFDPNDRSYVTSARNEAMTIFNENAFDAIDNFVVPLLSDAEYVEAFNLYLDLTIDFLDSAKSGRSYSTPITTQNAIILLVVSIVGGLLIAAAVNAILVHQMKTAVIKTEAHDYVKSDGFILTQDSDLFVNKTISRRHSPQNKSNGSSGSRGGYGGSRSSRGGKF